MDNSKDQEYRYDVFLSYRHKPLDNRICKKLHTLLETYKPTRRFKLARISRVFRDDEELPVAGILSDTIVKALTSSRYLVVVCSPDTPESGWVDREVRTFIELGRSDRVFALLLAGTHEQSFPPSLKRVQGIESRTLRVGAAKEKQIIRKLKRERLRIIAAVSGLSWDHFRVSNRRRSVRRLVLTTAALMILLVASGLYLLQQWLLASYYNIYAKKEEILIYSVVQNVAAGLQERLMEVPEAVPVVAEILEENLIYLENMAALDTGLTHSGGYLGAGYLRTISAWIDLGDFDRAAEYADKAVEEYERLASDRSSPEGKEDLLRCYSVAGICMQYSGNYDQAIFYYSKGLSLGSELEKQHATWDIEGQIALNLNSLGDCYVATGQVEDAEIYYGDSLEIYLEMASSGDLSERELAGTYDHMASTLHNAGFYDQAFTYYQQEMTHLCNLLDAGTIPDDTLHTDLALCYANQGFILLFQGDNQQAVNMLEQASETLKSNPFRESNPEADYYQAGVLSSMGQAYQNMGNYPQAGHCFTESLSLLDPYAGDTDHLPVQRTLADNYRYMGLNSKCMNQTDQAVAWYTKAIALYDWLANDKQELTQLWGLAASLHDLGTVYMDDGDYEAAKPLLFRALDTFRAYGEGTGLTSALNNTAVCNNNIGLCFYNQADYGGAIPYLLSAAAYYQSRLEQSDSHQKSTFADCCGYLGRCYAYQGEYDKAKSYHQESALVFESLSREQPGHLKSYALSLYWAAIDRILLGETEQAEDYYILCLDRCNQYIESGDRSFSPTYLSLYAFYYLVFGDDFQQALNVSRQAWLESPGDMVVKKIYGYCLLFSEHGDESEELLSELLADHPLNLELIRFDLEVFKACGHSDDKLEPLIRLLEK